MDPEDRRVFSGISCWEKQKAAAKVATSHDCLHNDESVVGGTHLTRLLSSCLLLKHYSPSGQDPKMGLGQAIDHLIFALLPNSATLNTSPFFFYFLVLICPF